ncbi:MAG: hypothetical protein ACOZBL_00660, partial [Patescibacteria group bacterium]
FFKDLAINIILSNKYYQFFVLLETINFVDHFLIFLVLFPGGTGFQLNDLGYFKPISVCHSQPQCGWSTGFIDFQRTRGFLQSHLCLQAFQITIFL